MRRVLLALGILLASCGVAFGAVWQPTPRTTWQWQLTGSINTTVPAAVYDIDGFDNSAFTVAALHAQGRRVICYFSAGSYENWRPDASSFPASVKGSGNGWPGENWLDIRNTAVLQPIMAARIQMCANKGFDGIEPDNVDGYTNSTGFPLTAADQANYNRMLATLAHNVGLSAGLKNDVDQVGTLQPNFNFAVNEQCWQYSECGPYSSFVNAGKAVFNAEYSGYNAATCTKANALGLSTIFKDLNLGAGGTPCLPGTPPGPPVQPGGNPPPPPPPPPTVKPKRTVIWRFTCRGKYIRYTVNHRQRTVTCPPGGTKKVKRYVVTLPKVIVTYVVVIKHPASVASPQALKNQVHEAGVTS